MASSKLSLLLAILSIWVLVDGASHRHTAPAPAPTSVDCTSLVINMADCLSFVSNDSTTTKPEAGCCAGLKTVLNTNADCLCEAFKSSAQFGVVLNVTKAVSLPTACKIHASPASNCGLSLPTGGALGSDSTSGIVLTPAPSPGSPGSSGSHGLSISLGSLLIGLALAFFPSI